MRKIGYIFTTLFFLCVLRLFLSILFEHNRFHSYSFDYQYNDRIIQIRFSNNPVAPSAAGDNNNSSSNHHDNNKPPPPLVGVQAPVASNKLPPLSTQRRTKAHVCHNWNHNGISKQILLHDFKFTRVNAMKTDDWDIIFGGYPHCGSKKFDWNMETGLNAKLNKMGWDSLRPHQAWYPCMGCRTSYCDKVQLCHLVRQYDPDECLILPQDLDRMRQKLVTRNIENSNSSVSDGNGNSDKTPTFVLKRDHPDLHVHSGNGVWFISDLSQLENAQNITDGTYIAQPYHAPYLPGKPGDPYHRKSELMIYLTVTSTHPLRIYAYRDIPVIHAFKKWKQGSDDKCMHDTHLQNRKCQLRSDMGEEDRVMLFSEYAAKFGENEAIADDAMKLLSFIIHKAQPEIQKHPVNSGIAKSGAMCFSFLRADFGVSSTGKPVLYEINEFPFIGGKQGSRLLDIKKQALRELFHMVGLDHTPLAADKREEWETANLGGWIRLRQPSPTG